jgi:hypothetical protein
VIVPPPVDVPLIAKLVLDPPPVRATLVIATLPAALTVTAVPAAGVVVLRPVPPVSTMFILLARSSWTLPLPVVLVDVTVHVALGEPPLAVALDTVAAADPLAVVTLKLLVVTPLTGCVNVTDQEAGEPLLTADPAVMALSAGAAVVVGVNTNGVVPTQLLPTRP